VDDIVLKTEELRLKRRGFGPLTLQFQRGEIVMLCGTSGSGKSTLCQLLSETQEPSEGKLDAGVTQVGYVAHEFENQLVGSTVAEELSIGARGGQAPPRAGLEEALQLLEEPLQPFLKEDPHQLSAALQQYLLLGSLLRSGADFLILDESMAYLDARTRQQFSMALGELAEAGCTILLVSHQEQLLELAHRVVFMERGEAAFIGNVTDFRDGYFERAGFRKEGPTDTLMSRLSELADCPVDGLEIGAFEHRLKLPQRTSLVLGGFSGAGTSWALNSLMGLESCDDWSCPQGSLPDCLLRQHVAPSFWRSTCAGEIKASRGAFAEVPHGLEEAVLNSIPAGWLEKAPWQLSHGQLRFFGASCLLLQMPRVLFLDHPFQGLDGTLREKLRYSLSEYLKKEGRVVLTTHFPEQVRGMGHQVVWLESQNVAWAGLTTVGAWESFQKGISSG
jgi:ABC-type multidrug transport system ATPase subunit